MVIRIDIFGKCNPSLYFLTGKTILKDSEISIFVYLCLFSVLVISLGIQTFTQFLGNMLDDVIIE